MSTAVTMFQWRRAMAKSDLPSMTKLVLHTLADFTNEFGQMCWPALETLAERAGIAVRTATKHLRIARAAGWLDSWKSRRPGRQWAHSHYRLLAPAGCLNEDQHGGAGSDGGGVDEFVERRAGEVADADDPALIERDTLAEASEPAAKPESNWHESPTNNPENGKTKETSLSHTTEVHQSDGGTREHFSQDSEPTELADWMLGRLKAADPGCDEPSLRNWASEIERMRRVDGRDERSIVRLFSWALRDKFWKRIITSPHRLRKHWAEVRRRRNAALEESGAPPSGDAVAPTTDDRFCAHVDASGARCTHVATILGIGEGRRGYCRHHVGYYED